MIDLKGLKVGMVSPYDFSHPGGVTEHIRVRSLHPTVTLEQVRAATGFPLQATRNVPTTAAPSAEQLQIIRRLDPHGLRATVIKGNPSAFAPRTTGQPA